MVIVGAALLWILALPDVTIRTEARDSGQSGEVTTNVLYIKGPNQRRESILTLADGDHVLPVEFTQCDQERIVELNPAARIYGYRSLSPLTAAANSFSVTMPKRSAGPTVDINIDYVDTGERRQVGAFVARHVITTTTVRPGPGAISPSELRTQDGWYLDVPPFACGAWGHYRATLLAGRQGERVTVTKHGAPPTGLAIEETDRNDLEGIRVERTVRLIEISDRSIDPALFTIPSGYRAALPLPAGGVDMTQPDTWANRAKAYWQYASRWIQQMLR